jgi:hypothetical protein
MEYNGLERPTFSSIYNLVFGLLISFVCIVVNQKLIKDLNEDDKDSRKNGNGINVKDIMIISSKA